LTAEECRTSLNAVLKSKMFRSSASQRQFLRYVGECHFRGETGSIKEYRIGVDALQRGEDFDPRLDSVVRVMARKIRAALERYYATEGASDRVRVELPKGAYQLLFYQWQHPEQALAFAPSPDESGAQVFQPPPLATPTVPQTTLANPSHRLEKSRTHWLAFSGAMLVLLGMGIVYLLPGYSDVAAASLIPSVAVLPFSSFGEAKEDQYLAAGMTDEIIASLERTPGVRVAGRGSSARFNGDHRDLREVGEKLRVHTLVEGVVRKTGDRAHVTVHLVNVANGYELWSASYDRRITELPAATREITLSIGNAVGAPLLKSAAGKPSVSGSNPRLNTPAYQDYLAGRHFWGQLTAASMQTAIRYFEQAIAKDSSFAPAHAALANCYALLPQLTDGRTSEMNSRVREAARRALELDSTLGEAHVALAMAAAYESNWAEAGREYNVGLTLNPGDPVAHLWFGGMLALTGRIDEALVQRRLAAELDPLSAYAQEALARAYYHARRYDEAIAQFQHVLTLDPRFGLAHHNLARVYARLGRWNEALAELNKGSGYMGPSPRRRASLAVAYARLGRHQEADRILTEFLDAAERGPFPAIALAEVYIGLGENERALDWLEKAVDQRDIFINADPLYDPVRNHPRFSKLLRRIAL
jgi:TolB-like protein/tetratricopeptide (TPR) repeat protein